MSSPPRVVPGSARPGLVYRLLFIAVLFPGCDDGAPPNASDPFAEARREIARAQRAPLPAGNVKITITRYELANNEHWRIAGLLRYRDGHVRVEAGGLAANGLRVLAARDGWQAGLGVSRRRGTREEVSRQFLVLMSGAEGSFSAVKIGREAWPVVIPVWYGPRVITTIRERVTGTGMRLRVRSAGPRAVVVELTPYFHRAGRRGLLLVNELRTTLSVIPGRSYIIAADERGDRRFGAAFLTAAGASARRKVVILLRAEVGGPQ